jgi:hypothetical protein
MAFLPDDVDFDSPWSTGPSLSEVQQLRKRITELEAVLRTTIDQLAAAQAAADTGLDLLGEVLND